MKSIDGPTVKKLIILIFMVGIVLYYSYNFYYDYVYKSINIKLKSNTTIEYGSEKIDVKEFIKSVDGEIVSENNELDTNIIGEQEVILKVRKANVEKEIPVVISVVDSTAPVISLKNDVVKIIKGDTFNLNDNILSVVDEIDGNIEYSDNNEVNLKNYKFTYSDNIYDVGTHMIVVEAIDSYGNMSTADYMLMVEESPFQKTTKIHYNLAANRYSDTLVSIAYSLLGKPYGHGNGPDIFDCSGLVQYIYANVGISVSRSSYTQLYDGVAVSRGDMKPGDIICWGNGESVSHTAIYVGNDQMIHAANPSRGVILSSVTGWDNGSSTDIISIRRI